MNEINETPAGVKIENPDTIAFRTWLRFAKPGETYIYYIGNLAEARQELTTQPEKADGKSYDWTKGSYTYYVWREPLHGYASAVYDAYERGDVLLTQKRLAEGRWEYRATRTKTPLSKRRTFT